MNDCTRCGNPLAHVGLLDHQDGCDCETCRKHCWSQYGQQCPEKAPEPHHLDAACESLRKLATVRDAYVQLRVWPNGHVTIWDGAEVNVEAHLDGEADDLPLPSEALARITNAD